MCAIRGRHVYKITWFSVINEKLNCKKNDRENGLSYDKHAVEAYFKDGTLVRHKPIELSNLIYFFLKSAEENFASAVTVVPRKRQVGVVVPAKFMAATKNLRAATVFRTKYLIKKINILVSN